jgi:hypothetical protein
MNGGNSKAKEKAENRNRQIIKAEIKGERKCELICKCSHVFDL